MRVTKQPGITAGFETVTTAVHDTGDPDEVVAAIMDPDRRGELYPLYHQLRSLTPLYQTSFPLMKDSWVVSRFAEAELLYRNSSVIVDGAAAESFNHGDGAFYRCMKHMLLFMEPSEHSRVRSLVIRAFTPRAVAALRPITQDIADDLLDGVADDGGMDVVSQYAYLLPIRVIARILGVPDEDFAVVEDLAWDFARAGEHTVDPEVARRGDLAAEGFRDYFERLIARRKSQPGDDVVSALAAAENAGQLSRDELISSCVLLLQAGHETTADLIGNGLVGLFRHPDQLSRLQNEPEITRAAVEEILRYDGSVQVNHRTLIADVRIGDNTLEAGDEVQIFVGAANRDPARFDEPDRLDLGRTIDHHLAFAFGAYYCIGASLARTETQVGLRTLLDRFPDLRPSQETFEWRKTLRLRGPQELLVSW